VDEVSAAVMHQTCDRMVSSSIPIWAFTSRHVAFVFLD